MQLLAILMLVLWLPAAPAGAATLRGTLHVPGPRASAASAGAYPGRASSLPGTRPVTRGAVTDAVISFERIPAAADSAIRRSGARPRLVQRDQMFDPRVLAIAAGTTVDFPNQDPIYHNVFSVSPTRRFDLGKYPRGHSRSVTFTKPGLVNVYCDIHSDMAAYILVLPNAAFAQPDGDGAFALPDVPPGRYRLRVWHPDLGTLERDVHLAPGGDAIELAFAR